MKWNDILFLKLTAGIIAGILLHNIVRCPINSCYFVLLLSVIFFLFYIISVRSRTNRYGIGLSGVLGISFFVLLGYTTATLNFLYEKPTFAHTEIEQCSYYSADIISNPGKTQKNH